MREALQWNTVATYHSGIPTGGYVSPVNEDNAYERLRRAILSLDLVPGERLSERGLESVLGTSRTPIRVALMRLENDGLTQRSGRGWQVAPIDVAEVRAVME